MSSVIDLVWFDAQNHRLYVRMGTFMMFQCAYTTLFVLLKTCFVVIIDVDVVCCLFVMFYIIFIFDCEQISVSEKLLRLGLDISDRNFEESITHIGGVEHAEHTMNGVQSPLPEYET